MLFVFLYFRCKCNTFFSFTQINNVFYAIVTSFFLIWQQMLRTSCSVLQKLCYYIAKAMLLHSKSYAITQ